jgi:hypothetical protein
MVEAQNRGSLHIHVFVWLYDFINPQEYKRYLQNNEFVKRIIEYLDNIIKCDFDDLIKDESEAKQDDTHPCCKI